MKNPLDFLLDDTRCAALAPAALGALARLSLRYLRGDLPGDNEAVRMLAGVDPEQWPWVLDALLPFLASDAAGNLRIVPLIQAKEAAARRSESSRRSVAARWQRVRDTNVIRTYPERITNVLDADQQAANDQSAPIQSDLLQCSDCSSASDCIPSVSKESTMKPHKRRAKFSPPTIDQIEQHMLAVREEHAPTIPATEIPTEAKKFYYLQDSRGWRQNNRRHVDPWESAANGWLLNAVEFRQRRTPAPGTVYPSNRARIGMPDGDRNKNFLDAKL